MNEVIDRHPRGLAVRQAARKGQWPGSTRGSAPGMVQCNIVILQSDEANEFAQWCALNTDVAPVIAQSKPGEFALPDLGADLDMRFDLPAYRLFENGEPIGEVNDLESIWRDDMVVFAFGCSFSLEDALREGGIPLDYEHRGFGGAIYVTGRDTVSHGKYAGPLVVSMRPIKKDHAQRAVDLCKQYPMLHGAPVHVGDPAALGIELDKPLQALGDLSIADDEVPVFWACWVTTQYVIENAKPKWAASHVSARMLVTDLGIGEMRVG